MVVAGKYLQPIYCIQSVEYGFNNALFTLFYIFNTYLLFELYGKGCLNGLKYRGGTTIFPVFDIGDIPVFFPMVMNLMSLTNVS